MISAVRPAHDTGPRRPYRRAVIRIKLPPHPDMSGSVRPPQVSVGLYRVFVLHTSFHSVGAISIRRNPPHLAYRERMEARMVNEAIRATFGPRIGRSFLAKYAKLSIGGTRRLNWLQVRYYLRPTQDSRGGHTLNSGDNSWSSPDSGRTALPTDARHRPRWSRRAFRFRAPPAAERYFPMPATARSSQSYDHLGYSTHLRPVLRLRWRDRLLIRTTPAPLRSR